MPVSGGGFEQSYNAQAAVDTQTMLVVAAHVTQASNDKRQIVPILEQIAELPQDLGHVQTLLADTGYFSAANVRACEVQGIVPLLSMTASIASPTSAYSLRWRYCGTRNG